MAHKQYIADIAVYSSLIDGHTLNTFAHQLPRAPIICAVEAEIFMCRPLR